MLNTFSEGGILNLGDSCPCGEFFSEKKTKTKKTGSRDEKYLNSQVGSSRKISLMSSSLLRSKAISPTAVPFFIRILCDTGVSSTFFYFYSLLSKQIDNSYLQYVSGELH